MNEVWPGFLNPHPGEWPACETCCYEELPTFMSTFFPTPRHGTGLTPEAYAISQTFYPHMIGGPMAQKLAWCDKLGQAEVDRLIEKGRLLTLVQREPTEDNPRDWEWLPLPRKAEEVNAANRPGARGMSGHDAINRSYLIQFRCERLGIVMQCPACEGHGDIATAAQRKEADDWEETEPPTGDGWQLWETVSEGSPISPVFATEDELASWMSDPERGDQWVPGHVAAKFIADGWAPSLVGSANTGVVSGVEFVGTQEVSG
jgi:hypothetical protein